MNNTRSIKNDDFIMLPTVDFCFKELMQDATVRKGIIGALYSDLLGIYVLELGKLPPEDQNESGIIRWMRFFNGKTKEDFRMMAEKDEYIKKAYDCLEHMSADEEKRIGYDARQKAIMDYHSFLEHAEKQGWEAGRKAGLEAGRRDGISEGRQQATVESCQEFGLTQTETIAKLLKKFSLSETEAQEFVKKYWK